MRTFAALLLILMSCIVVGCGGESTSPTGSTGQPGPQALASGLIGPAGGTVRVSFGELAGVSVTIPPGALASDVLITISAGADLEDPDFDPWGPAVLFGPPGTAFALPVTVTLPIPAAPSLTSSLLVGHLNESAGAQTRIQPFGPVEGETLLSLETTTFSTFQGMVPKPSGPSDTPTPRADVPANAALNTANGAVTWNPLIPPLSTDTFLTSASYPEGPGSAFNPDGTLASNPVVDKGVVTVNGVEYDLRALSSDNTISLGRSSKVVYSAVPLIATTDFAYGHLDFYYHNDSTDLVHPDPIPTPLQKAGTVNSGAKSSVGPDPTASSYDPNTPVYLASNNATDDPHYFLPNLPNGRGSSGYLDHLGLTENVCWTFNPFKFTLAQKHYDTGLFWRFCHGWASPSESANQTVQWNKLDSHNLNADNPGGAAPLQLDPNSNRDLVSATIAALQSQTLAGLNTLFGANVPQTSPPGWSRVNTGANADNSTWASVQQLPVWLLKGAFITYQPVPGFQCNLLRQNTPGGTYTVAENASMLMVQNGGKVEIPAAYSGTQVTGPVPLVTQTWVDQRFVVYNELAQVVPSTQDQYPGEEYYYLGNTYLPGTAGVVNRWTHYPRMTLVSSTGAAQPDERDTDCWLGLRGDQPWDVMAWMVGYTVPPNALLPHPNDLGHPELGGQARKPYMLGASQQLKSTTDSTVLGGLRLENSNSFWWAQVPSTDSSLNQMYATTMCIDPDGGGAKGYLPVAKIWWKWVAQSFEDASATNTYTWVKQKSALGTWVPQFQWLVQSGPAEEPTKGVKQFPARGFPTGWFNQLPGPNANLGNSGSANVFTLSGPAPGGASTGVSVSLTVNEAQIPAGNAPEAIVWSPPATSGPFSPPNQKTSAQTTNGSTNNQVGMTVQRYTIKAVTPVSAGSPNFLIVLGAAPTN